MELSVVILNYNAAPFLQLCLESVRAAIQNIDAEIIVADNNSSDNSLDIIAQYFPEVKLVTFNKNHGFSRGNNLAVQGATGRYICILNPDTVVPEDVFVNVLAFAKAHAQDGPIQETSNRYSSTFKGLGFVGVRLIDGSGHFLPESKRHIPTPQVARQKLLGNDNFYYFNELKDDEDGDVEILVGAFMFCETSVYHDCGGFDERYFMYGEDIDLSYTALKLGYSNYYLGSTTVLHFKGESTVKNKEYYKRFYGAMGLFYNKYFKQNGLEKLLSATAVQLMIYLKSIKSEKAIEQPRLEQILVTEKEETYVSGINGKSSLQGLNGKSRKTLILDTSSYNYKKLIAFLDRNKRNFTYRFLLKSKSTIIGSDSSNRRGSIENI